MNRWVVLGFGVLTLLLVNLSVFQKERTAKNGERLLLALRPVDPRSLMQGDYMRLAYEKDEETLALVRARPRTGTLVVTRGEGGVAEGFAFDDGAPLREGQVRLWYRARHSERDDAYQWLRDAPWIAPESFMFQEGTAERYERARYAELRVAEDGHAVLIGLCDEAREPLGYSAFR